LTRLPTVSVGQRFPSVIHIICTFVRFKLPFAGCLLASDIDQYLELKEIEGERTGGSRQGFGMAQIEIAGARQRFVADHAPRLQPRLDEFIAWFRLEPRLGGFMKVAAWRVRSRPRARPCL
jgi:hypothetical protein